MRVLVIDGEARVRSALLLLLRYVLGITTIDEAETPAEALSLADAHEPDLIIVDWEVVTYKGMEFLKHLRCAAPQARVVALSGRMEIRNTAMDAGVDAFVSKIDPPEMLLKVLREVPLAASHT